MPDKAPAPETPPAGCGIVYIATGAAYSAATVEAAESARRHNPNLPLHFFTDQPIEAPVFDRVERIDNPHYRSKVEYLWRSPFERTLYLDSDTRVAGDLSEMFRLLDRFDLAVAHVRNRHYEKRLRNWKVEVPKSFPQHNCGVLLYRRTPAVTTFLKDWQQAYAEAGFKPDQITFRELLWRSSLNYYVLPPEYNMRSERLVDRLFYNGPPVLIWHLERWQPKKQAGLIGRVRTRLGL